MIDVSIIIPSYNSSLFIESVLISIDSQRIVNWEAIIVDDCSSDETVEIVKKYTDRDERFKLIRMKENSGAAICRNVAIREAKGRYIAFLDSDDLWKANKLERQLSFMKENDIAFSYTAYEKIDENGKVVGHVGVPEKVSYNDLLKVCSIGCLTAMYDTAKVGKVYMPLIRKRQDLGLWLRILKKVPYAYGINETLAQYRVRSDSISANKLDAAKYTWSLYRQIERLNLPKSLYYFSFYAVNGVLRTKFPRVARFLGVLK